MSSLTFPVNLGELIEQDGSFPHVRISCSQKGAELENINLYLPSGLSLSDGASYTGISMSNVRAGQLKARGQKLSDADKEILGMDALANFSEVFGNFSAAAKLDSGIASNPNTEQAFESMNIRSFSIEWKMVPESLKDAEAVRDIINFFRKYMYPKRMGTFALEYPAQFKLQFYVGEVESLFLPTFYNSYLTELSVNYNSQEGAMIYLKDLNDYIGTNVSVSCTFGETKMLTRDELYPENSLFPIQNADRPPFPDYNAARAQAESDEANAKKQKESEPQANQGGSS